jgi:hypothetical protein
MDEKMHCSFDDPTDRAAFEFTENRRRNGFPAKAACIGRIAFHGASESGVDCQMNLRDACSRDDSVKIQYT